MSTHRKSQSYTPGQHIVRGIPIKAHKIEGFTPEMLEQHFEQDYGGAVRRLNELESRISGGDDNVVLRAEQLTVSNSVILHELHFASLGEDGGEKLQIWLSNLPSMRASAALKTGELISLPWRHPRNVVR